VFRATIRVVHSDDSFRIGERKLNSTTESSLWTIYFIVATSFYNAPKNMTVSERKEILFYLSQIAEIIGIDKQKILKSISNDDFSDFEDCLQAECAKSFFADWVVTRNIKDFGNSAIKAITPDEFLKIL
jgi:hypothetical protein